MKTKQGGYKAMIRDRVPNTVDLALKWLKIKTKWVDHVYYSFVWYLSDKKDRNYQVRAILGIAKHQRNFVFKDTIDWDNLDPEEIVFWENICNWVKWFEESLLPIKETYETLKLKGTDEESIKTYICNKRFQALTEEQQDSLYKCIIEHIKKYYV